MENETHMEEQILEADKLYNDGEYGECKRKLLDLLDQEPAFGRAHDLLACLYYHVFTDLTKSAEHLRLAVKFTPTFVPAYINYARILNFLNRKKELHELIEKALQVEGMNKCIIEMERGKSFEINREYKKALQAYYEARHYAITYYEVQEVKACIKRLKVKSFSPFKKINLLLTK
jgi:hypothetical protein